MTIRFIHSSDLHIGRKFANIPQPPDGNIRGRLMEARHGAIARMASAARDIGAAHVLLAGDSFDTATPSPTVIRQALAAMGEATGITWWLLPGNHDNLRDAEPLWEAILRNAPPNLRPITSTEAVEIAPGVSLLPCPTAFRASGVDPTAQLGAIATPEGHMRLALAHGGVTDFTESGGSIAPDRDRSAGLDYLALGDWHGRMKVSERVHYPGSPEQDRFKHNARGVCLGVTLEAAGAAPNVQEIETGAFLWSEAALPLHSGQDPAPALGAILPETGRRDVLLRVRASGWSGLAEQVALRQAAQRIAPEFAHFELVTSALGTEYGATDLDEIDRAGALRRAAETLLEDAESDALSQRDRDIAAGALARLYAYVKEDAQ